MQKKSYRRPQLSAAAQSANNAIGSLFESLESRTLLSAAPQPLLAQAASAVPVITVSPTKFKAQENGSRPGYIAFARTGDTSKALTVNVTLWGTAANGRDYKTVPNTLTFAAGQATAYITVNPLQDTQVERTESVNAAVVAGSGYTIGTADRATAWIYDDDAPTVSISTVQNASIAEDGGSDAVFTFTRVGDLKHAVTISYAIKGAAKNGVDYKAIAKTITIPAGKTTAKLTIKPVDDLNNEGDEYVDLRVAGGYYNIGSGRAYIKIHDNEPELLGLDFITFRNPFDVDGNSYILRAPAAGGAPTNISTALTNLGKTGKDYAVNASPDGLWMLISTTRFGGLTGGSLALIPTSNLAAGQQILINGTNITPVDGDIAVASGGNLIIYASADGPHSVDLWAATRADNNSTVWSKTLITGDSTYAYNVQPAISSDGTKLLFAAGNAAGDHGTEAILEVNVDGTGLQTRLDRTSNAGAANATAYLEHPDYAPDGSIVFGSNWDNKDQIWRKPAGANPPATISAAVNEFCPAVLPNGDIVSLWKDRPGNINHVLEITTRHSDGTVFATLIPGDDIPLQDIGASA